MGIGIGEMIVIAGIALVIIGPDKFPEFAKICVRTIRDLRSYVEEAKDDLRKELAPLKKEIDQVKSYDPESYIDALTDSRDETDDYSATYGQHTEDQDTDYEAYGMYGADDRAAEKPKTESPTKTPENPAGTETTESAQDEAPPKDASEPADSETTPTEPPAGYPEDVSVQDEPPTPKHESEYDTPKRQDG